MTESAKNLISPPPYFAPCRGEWKGEGVATPTLKVKRKHISEVFKDLIEAGYGD